MKKQNGITLVALVITIIVLLILAGVSISLALGNNGVLTRSSQAVVQNEKGTVEQEIKLGIADCVTNYWTAWAQNASVKKSSYYLTATVQNSCTIGTVTVTNNLSNVDTGSVTVQYVVTASGQKYTCTVSVADGSISNFQGPIAN
jgi:hypothetical protein